MDFKLSVGDVCRLNSIIPGIYASGDWKTGLYRVEHIWDLCRTGKDKENSKTKSYHFAKIRKDGTPYKSFNNGYNCIAWDKMIDDGKVSIISTAN